MSRQLFDQIRRQDRFTQVMRRMPVLDGYPVHKPEISPLLRPAVLVIQLVFLVSFPCLLRLVHRRIFWRIMILHNRHQIGDRVAVAVADHGGRPYLASIHPSPNELTDGRKHGFEGACEFVLDERLHRILASYLRTPGLVVVSHVHTNDREKSNLV